eukprot:3405988-Pyramimonas_sp.AAC.1
MIHDAIRHHRVTTAVCTACAGAGFGGHSCARMAEKSPKKRPAAAGGRPAGSATSDLPPEVEKLVYQALANHLETPEACDYGPAQDDAILVKHQSFLKCIRAATKNVNPARSIFARLLETLADEREGEWKLCDRQTSWAESKAKSIGTM